jgi:hypothetical protein
MDKGTNVIEADRDRLRQIYAVHFAQVLNGHRHERKCHRKNKNVTGRITMSPEE